MPKRTDLQSVLLIGSGPIVIGQASEVDYSGTEGAMARIGLNVPRSGYARSMDEARAIQRTIGFPVILRPSFTMGGQGAAVAYNVEELEEKAAWGIAQSPRGEILVEESILGWKEFELELMRDGKDNVVVI